MRPAKLRTRVLLGYGAAVFAVLIVLAWGIWNLARLGRAADAILRENYRSIAAADQMLASLGRQETAVLLLELGYEQRGASLFSEQEVEFLQWLSRARDNITVEGEAEIVREIEDGYADLLDRFAALRAGGSNIEPAPRAPPYLDQVAPLLDPIRRACLRLRDLNESAMVAASERAKRLSRRAIVSSLALGLALAAAGLVLSILWSGHVVRPLEAMTAATERIAQRQYDVALPTSATGELGQLARALDTMSKSLEAFTRMDIGQIVAERNRSEGIIRSISDGIVVLDPGFRIVTLNPVAARILETDTLAAQGKPLAELIADESILERIRAQAAAPDQRGRPAEDVVLPKGGPESTRHYRIAATRIDTGPEGNGGVVLVVQDVTHYAELDRLKTEFVATASHQLRTPLTSIALGINLLNESLAPSLSERDRELLDSAREEAQRMRALVDELLDLSRLESGQLRMEMRPVEIGPLLAQVLPAFVTQADEKGVALQTELPPDLPAMRADAAKIGWVLANLLSNALRFTDRGGHVLVSADAVGEFVQISVSDDGIGIPFEQQARIFSKFVQLDGQRAAGGSGLGLAIAREVVRAHGGAIWVDSTPKRGSTFTFTIPVARPRSEVRRENHV